MSFIDVFIIAIGLSMDAFAVATTNGMNEKTLKIKKALIIALFFGVFQGGMTLIGYYAGSLFSKYIEAIDHWVAFVLLAIIGGTMIFEAFKKEKNEEKSITIKILIVQAIATSIDALAIGISFAALKGINIYFSISIIGLTTLLLSFVACYIGKKFGQLLNNKAQLVGGLILVCIGLKIFIEHMFF